MLQIPELLAPAGDLERLRYAINYGADAVYCSLPEFGMRSAPANFTPEQLTEGVIYAHARGRKVYLTMNTLPTNEEADRLPDAIKEAAKAGVDAFIVADLGVLDACKTVAPDIDVHMSTQTGITNWAAARAAYNLGAKRVVLAREMSLQDIAILRDKTPPELEIEAFVHGAMCMSVSGRFKDYMPEMEGKYDITTCPVFEEGQKCSVGIGGTGTVVTNQCENPELAAEWLAWAKCSEEGENLIWNELGFDVCNTALWSDEDFAYDGCRRSASGCTGLS